MTRRGGRRAIALVSLALAAAALVVMQSAVPAQASSASTAGTGPATSVDGFDAVQLDNARQVIAAGVLLHLGFKAEVLAVTAAMGESDLQNLPYGDGALNPDGTLSDSLGLFQQQHWWGSVADRMNPSRAATAFYEHLEDVPDWAAMTPTGAIHAVQGNADPDYYAPYYPMAYTVVTYLIANDSEPAGQHQATDSLPSPPVFTDTNIGAIIQGDLVNQLIAAGGVVQG